MLKYFLLTLLRRSPGIIVMLIATGLSLARMRRHPKVSLITLAGVALYFFRLIFFPLVFYYLPEMAHSLSLSEVQLSWWYTAVNVLDDALLAFVVILFVIAAFTGRQRVPDNPNLQGIN